ncbi:MAG: NAD-dependent epimerase/dehydratase family protein, partial [Acidobacteriota bacterium]
MRKVLVTGAGGFVGSHLCAELAAAGLRVRAAMRKQCSFEALPAQLEQEAVGEVGPSTDWGAALTDV